MSINQSDYNPSLRFDSRDTQTWTSGTTKTVTDGAVTSRSIILVTPSVLPAGHWKIVVSSGSFTITSTDAETSVTFNYIVF